VVQDDLAIQGGQTYQGDQKDHHDPDEVDQIVVVLDDEDDQGFQVVSAGPAFHLVLVVRGDPADRDIQLVQGVQRLPVQGVQIELANRDAQKD